MRIALIHAVRVAMDPVAEAFGRLWPEAVLVNLLDDSLSADLARDGELTAATTDRFVALARYAAGNGADGILFTCSAFGPCIEAAQNAVDIPVLKPNEAMFCEGSRMGPKIGLLASFAPSLPPMEAEFREVAADVELRKACVPAAMEALSAGDGNEHDALLAEAGGGLRDCVAIMLAQFSNARAREAVAKATGLPVLTAPDSAVRAMRARLGG